MRTVLVAISLAVFGVPVSASPAPSDGGTRALAASPSERHAILDALRPTAARIWSAPITFVVKDLRVDGDVAYVSVAPERPDGRKVTMMLAGGMANAYGDGFLRRTHGLWHVLTFRAGSSDTWECVYPGVPRSILPTYC